MLERELDRANADAIERVKQAGRWTVTDKVRAIEDKLNKLYWDALNGDCTPERYRAALGEWVKAGTVQP